MACDCSRTPSLERPRACPPAIVMLVAFASGCEGLIDAPFDEARPRAAGASCELVKPLPPPGVQAAPGDIQTTLVVSANDLAEGVSADGTPAYYHLGFDLDDSCTGRGDSPPCVTPAWTGADPVDGPGGIDNGVARMLYLQEQIFPIGLLTTDLVNTNMQTGQLAPTAVIRITDYNGAFADEDVSVELFVPHAPGLLGETFVPRFDGTDVWPLVAEYVEDPSAPEARAKLRATTAYVTRSELVARLDAGSISFLNMPIGFLSAVLTGKLQLDPALQQWRLLDGVIAGIARTDEILRAIPYGAYQTLGISICSDNADYPNVKKLLCSGADTTDVGGTPATSACELTSFGLGFQTVPVKLGAVLPALPPTANCTPETDPGNDTCAAPL